MDIFNLKSNDVKDFKRFMDMKAPAFGGPNETESFDKSKRKSLKEWTNIVKRDPNFENGGKNHNNDGYWKAFHSDVPSRAAKVKIEEPLNTPPAMGVTIVKESHVPQFENYIFEEDAAGTSYKVGQVLKAKRDKDGQLYTLKVIQVVPDNTHIVASITGPGKYEGKPLDGKGGWELNINQAGTAAGNDEMGTFTFESYMFEEADENDVELDEAPEIDEEALEMFMEEFSDELKEILEIACEKMEIEKEECVEIFKAAIQKVSEMPEEDESDEELDEDFDTITESAEGEETYATYDFRKDGHMTVFAYPHHNGKDTKESLRDWKDKDSDKRAVKFVNDYKEAQAGILRLKKASEE
jgi:hypothetical protein